MFSSNEQLSRICDGIYISDLMTTGNREVMEKNEIKTIISIGEEVWVKHQNINYHYIECPDDYDFPIVKIFPQVIEIMRKCERNILVHCLAGVNRSPAVVVAFLMDSQKISFDTAYKIVMTNRPCTMITHSFLSQLKPKVFSEKHCIGESDLRGKCIPPCSPVPILSLPSRFVK